MEYRAQKAIQAAFQEVNDALIDHASSSFRRGVTGLFNAELRCARAQGQLFFALINVYKSTGRVAGNGSGAPDTGELSNAAGYPVTRGRPRRTPASSGSKDEE